MHSTEWRDVRDYLLRGNVCTVHNAFSIDDKQSQQLATTIKPPPALPGIGMASFSIEAWCDARENFESLDVWNLFCSIICGIICEKGSSDSAVPWM